MDEDNEQYIKNINNMIALLENIKKIKNVKIKLNVEYPEKIELYNDIGD